MYHFEKKQNQKAINVAQALESFLQFFSEECVREKWFDPAILAELTGGNLALAAELAELFVRQGATHLEALLQENGVSLKDFRFHAHALKGSSRCVGAVRLAFLAEKTERKAAEEHTPPNEEELQVLREVAEKTFRAAEEFYQSYQKTLSA